MPKHNPVNEGLKNLKTAIEEDLAHLCSARCRSWIRQDIRSGLRGSLENLKHRVDMLEQAINEERSQKNDSSAS